MPRIAHRQWATFRRNRVALVGLVLALAIMGVSFAAPLLPLGDPDAQDAVRRLSPPGGLHPLGQDSYGRDVFSRLIHAGRVSLFVGISAVLLGGTIGTALGLIAGSSRRLVENTIMRLIDVLMAFPGLLLGLAVMAVLGSGVEKMILAIGLVITPAFARIAHSATLATSRYEFVEAARAVGAGQIRILSRHILPNIMGELVVLASLWVASAIRIEASLSFIGLGVEPPTPTWGNMIREGTSNLAAAPWLSVFPGIAILVAVLAFNLLGDGLRDALDPRLQQ